MRPIQHFICQAFTLAELITIGEQIMRVEPSGRGCTNRPYMHAKQSIHAAIIPRCLSIISAAIPLARGIHIAVAAMTCSIRIRLLLEVYAVLLLIGSSELSISGQISLLTDDGRRLGILIILLAGSQGHQGGQCKLLGNRNGLKNA